MSRSGGGLTIVVAVPGRRALRIDRIRQDQVEHAAVDVDVRDAHQLAVSEPVPAARSASDQRVGSGLEVVEVIAQAGDVDQAVDRQLAEPAEKPEVLDADDDRVKRLAESFLEVSQKLDSDQIALGGFGPAFGAGAVLAQGKQLVVVAAGLLPLEPGDQLAMDLQVGIAPDRRGEVAVVLACQGISAARARACRHACFRLRKSP